MKTLTHTDQATLTAGKELYATLYQAILPTIKSPREAQAIIQRILEHGFQYDQVSMVLDQPLTMTQFKQQWLKKAIQRIKKHEPIQYILGEAPFLGRDFKVSPDVLIPRPETEELVHHIMQENAQPGLAILDIGTGSGCIAITLQKAWPAAQVEALDISQQALDIAQFNAQRWQAAIHCIQADILHEPLPTKHWDIIVSNPPYVRLSEQKWMQRRVLAYEPRQALFVTDAAPLIFYERIIALAATRLKQGGKIYLEINEAFGRAIAHLLAETRFEAVRVMQDLQGKDRWVVAVAPTS
ncbi:MAG: peptide chain release factor N(5)-glutamine methyltransferase [Bacteroidota bacterium]